MYTDKLLRVSEAQAVTVTAVSTNSIDLSQPRDMGEGENLFMHFSIPTTFAGGTSLRAAVIIADDANLTTNVLEVGSTDTLPLATLVAGYADAVRIQPKIGSLGKRFMGARYTVVGTMTAGAITADVTLNVQDGRKNYPSGFTVV